MWIGQHEEESKSRKYGTLDQWRITQTDHSLPLLVFYSVVLSLFLQTGESTQTIQFEMEEEKPTGFLVGLLMKHLPDNILTGPGKLTFRTIQQGHADLFTLGSADGRVQVAKRIDRETLCPNPDERINSVPTTTPDCQLTFSVNLLRLTSLGTDIVDILRIVILLHDIDDNSCFFTPSHSQVITVPENVPPEQLAYIPVPSPCDLDTGPGNGIEKSSINLQISEDTGSPNEKPAFALELNRTNLITKPYALFLIPQRVFDYEKMNKYELVVEAGGKNLSEQEICRLRLTVQILDQNDFAPRFTQNSSIIKIPETASFNVPIYTLSAFDSDLGPVYSQLIYEFDVHATAAVLSRFRIDRSNGSIFIRAPLNYRQQSLYDIPLIVRNPLPNENENYPIKLSDILMNPNQAKFIDRALLRVHVLDVNDRPPVISVFTPDGGDIITLKEHNKDIPVDVAVVSVVDEDTGNAGAINCSLDATQQKQFALTPIGLGNRPPSAVETSTQSAQQPLELIYKLQALVSFDRETVDHVDVKIHCHDSGSPPLQAEHIVHIRLDDVNDHAPVLNQTKWHLAVNEDSDPQRRQIGHVIGKIRAIDPDIGVNARLTYELAADSPGRDYFTVDNETGVIRSLGNLDREKQTEHHLVFRVMDSGQPRRSATGRLDLTVLDYNDEQPVFEKQAYEFRIVENNGLGELVGSLRAFDKDEGTNAVIHFHMEPMNQYMYSLILSESRSSKTDVNSGLPFDLVSYFDTVHSSYEIRIYASKSIDREAMSISQDLDSEGIATLKRPSPDQKADTHNPSYKFWIVGEDAGTPKRRGQTLVQVFVDDVNDESPVFRSPESNFTLIGLSYLEKVGHAIWQLIAVDRDAGPNGTVKYQLEQIRFYNYTKPRNAAPSHQSASRQPADFPLTELFTLHPVTGILRLGQPLMITDVGCLFAVSAVAQDMGVPRVTRTSINFFVQVDDSEPVGDPMDDAGDFSVDTANAYIYGNVEDGSSMNFYIIISIVLASFMISAILISGICIALRKRKRNAARAIPEPENANGGTNIPMSHFRIADKLDVVVPQERAHNGNLRESSVEQSFPSPKIPSSPLITSGPIQIISTSTHSATPVNDPLLAYNPQLMQFINLPTSQFPNTSSDLKTLHLVCSEHGTMQRVVGNPYETVAVRSQSPEAIFLCAPDYTGQLYPASVHNPPARDSFQASVDGIKDAHATVQQPVTLINYSHPMEVQHLCVHPAQPTVGKRNSLGSTDQDSGNGDSLNTAPLVVAANKSIWLPTPLTISRTSPPVHSLTLPLVHVYTPLSCVAETESANNSSLV